jgi:hypothetical protein
MKNKNVHKINNNIYVTSDEKIEDVRPHKGKWQLEKGQILNKFPNYLTDLSECELVIMTTDPILIAEGVQAIDDEFLEWFVKNPSCESVEVEKIKSFDGFLDPQYGSPKYKFNYKIIIPKEEPKQEKLEQAANRLFYTVGNEGIASIDSFMKGAKWQAERMYSEGEVIDSIKYTIDNFFNGKIAGLNSKEIFEQFKKK